MKRGRILSGVLTACYILFGILVLALHKPDEDEWRFDRAAYDDADTYILQSRYDDGLLYFASFGRMAGERGFRIVWQVKTDEKVEVADFAVENKVISILALDKDSRKIFLFRKDGAQADEQVFHLDMQPVRARLRDGGIYILTADSQVYYTTLEGELRKCDGSVSYIYDDSGTRYKLSDIIGLNLSMAAQGTLPPFIIFTLAYIIVAVLLLITYRFIWQGRKLMYQTLAAIAFAVFAMLFILFLVLGSGEAGSGLPLFMQMALAWLVIVLLLFAYLWAKWRPVGMVMEQMDRVARGDYQVAHRHVADNEFGRIWRSMERICHHLQNKDYHNSGVLECLQQYAPRHFERLFGKGSIEDIEPGEAVGVQATAGLIAAVDKDCLHQKGYLQYVGRLLERLSVQPYAGDSIVFAGGGSLETVKAVFMDTASGGPGDMGSAAKALQYAIGCIESLSAVRMDGYKCMPLIMLHKSKCTCGLAGGIGQVYPFIASKELDLLGRYMGQFRQGGVRLVITGRAREELEGAEQSAAWMRYIGYLPEETENGKLRLYEVLDPYPAEKRESMLKARGKFDEALSAFYAGHFRRAECGFVDALKACPDDGVAKWYAHACEKLAVYPEDGIEALGLFSDALQCR